MDANQRRAAVAECLAKAGQPVSATALARQFSVSRQIIVGDIALLRASGLEVSATPRGYVLPKSYQGLEYRVACLHATEDMAQELENMLFFFFGLKDAPEDVGETESDEKNLLRGLIMSAANVIYLNNYIEFVRKQVKE